MLHHRPLQLPPHSPPTAAPSCDVMQALAPSHGELHARLPGAAQHSRHRPRAKIEGMMIEKRACGYPTCGVPLLASCVAEL